MKTNYEIPEFEVIEFGVDDVVCTSGLNNVGAGGDIGSGSNGSSMSDLF